MLLDIVLTSDDLDEEGNVGISQSTYDGSKGQQLFLTGKKVYDHEPVMYYQGLFYLGSRHFLKVIPEDK